MGLLRTIAIILIVYYVFKFISKYILPLFVQKIVKDVQKKYNEQQQNQYNDTSGKVGETVIAKKPIEPKSNKDVGDYVDYEEVKD
ncbi:DUF4834 family protein [Lutibacter sp.]|uniref:DUF4834 family protein n=1 Tax=Lutibacter sp. TaxID=1925666 RepID=UPI001A3273E7|nr:DUF4834 family protein [Lutibacter sp.]MBI9042716.1 DUF4834 family protein [Lutibacter sp.]